MRIAQIAPLFEPVPPPRYGGTERVVHWLVEELVRRGHDVTLFASGDSRTSARLAPVWPRALRLSGNPLEQPDALHTAAIHQALAMEPAFDVIHSHVDWVGLPFAASGPIVTTLHGRLDLPEIQAIARAFPGAPLVSISEDQRVPLRFANFLATVHHGLPLDGVPFVRRPDDYVAFVGRISRCKRPDIAIRAACDARVPLKIAAKVRGNREDEEYWHRVMEPLLAECPDTVEFVGEIGDAHKAEFMGRARALLFPVEWPEPFGLVAIEAMSFGTPVIATPRGALPEIVKDGRTGFIVNGLEEMVGAIRAADAIDRAECRRHVEERFGVSRMVDDYERVYREVARMHTGREDTEPEALEAADSGRS